jgi:hypothetical protein
MTIKQLQIKLNKESSNFGEEMVVIHQDLVKLRTGDDTGPAIAWRNRHFLAQIYSDGTHLRLSINRTVLNDEGHWVDGITWDELQWVKAQCGFSHYWAVEIYPADEHVICDANIRHLLLLGEQQPSFAWTSETRAGRSPLNEILANQPVSRAVRRRLKNSIMEVASGR